MKLKPRYEELYKRCTILEEMGFTICHNDSRVEHDAVPSVTFDFSATDKKYFLSEALKQTAEHYRKIGRNDIRKQFSDMMKCDEDIE